MNRGTCYAIAGYTIWGFFPFYWKMLEHVPVSQQMCHRIAWAFPLLLLAVAISGRINDLKTAVRRPRVLLIHIVAAVLISVNWLVFLWAVRHDFVVEASLGYFINPLISVVLGQLFLGERLRPGQWVAVAFAALGVGYLTLVYGTLPWISLAVATSFGLYGLVKKIAPLGTVEGLTLETGFLFMPVIAFLFYTESQGHGAFRHTGLPADLVMIGAGLITIVPLMFFTAATRRIPLSHMGILQYITPTGQFLLGIFVYGEPFDRSQFMGFAFVWVALVVFVAEGLLSRRYRQRPVAPLPPDSRDVDTP
jgi:chloramphenicol-sensitive protein RarD